MPAREHASVHAACATSWGASRSRCGSRSRPSRRASLRTPSPTAPTPCATSTTSRAPRHCGCHAAVDPFCTDFSPPGSAPMRRAPLPAPRCVPRGNTLLLQCYRSRCGDAPVLCGPINLLCARIESLRFISIGLLPCSGGSTDAVCGYSDVGRTLPCGHCDSHTHGATDIVCRPAGRVCGSGMLCG